MIVDCAVEANWPGITITDTDKKIAKFVEISVPLDVNIITKTADKISKYRDLEIAYKKCKEFRKVSENICVDMMQQNAVLGIAHILQHVLTDA
eukprot:7494295-Ditylum_brightwellii.AAC.1